MCEQDETYLSPDKWLELWKKGKIDWHIDHVAPHLKKHWSAVVPTGPLKVMVPLCGDSQDLFWLKDACGCEVVGVDVGGELAYPPLFQAAGVSMEVETVASGLRVYRDPNSHIRLYAGDFFHPDLLKHESGFDVIWDSGGLVAISPDLRVPYSQRLHELCGPRHVMLIESMEYKDDPAPLGDLSQLFGNDYDIKLLDSTVYPEETFGFEMTGLLYVLKPKTAL